MRRFLLSLFTALAALGAGAVDLICQATSDEVTFSALSDGARVTGDFQVCYSPLDAGSCTAKVGNASYGYLTLCSTNAAGCCELRVWNTGLITFTLTAGSKTWSTLVKVQEAHQQTGADDVPQPVIVPTGDFYEHEPGQYVFTNTVAGSVTAFVKLATVPGRFDFPVPKLFYTLDESEPVIEWTGAYGDDTPSGHSPTYSVRSDSIVDFTMNEIRTLKTVAATVRPGWSEDGSTGAVSRVVSAQFADGVCEPPTITIPGMQAVEDSDTDVDVVFFFEWTTSYSELHYTLDGSEPTRASPQAAGVRESVIARVGPNAVIKAKVFGDAIFPSKTVSATFAPTSLDPPHFLAVPMTVANLYQMNFQLTTKGERVYYTTDGTDPDPNEAPVGYEERSTQRYHYDTPFFVSASTEVRAIAVYGGYLQSEIAVWKGGYTLDTAVGPQTATARLANALALASAPAAPPTVLVIESVRPVDAGVYELTIGIGDVSVGASATPEMLAQVVKVEGATCLSPANYSEDNVTLAFGTPVDGKVKVTVRAKDPDVPAFYIRAKLVY